MRVRSFGAAMGVVVAMLALPSLASATLVELRDVDGKVPTTIKIRSFDLRADTATGAIVCPHTEFKATRRGTGRYTVTNAFIGGGFDCPVIPTAGRLKALVTPIEFRDDVKFREDGSGNVKVETRLDFEVVFRDDKLGGVIRECKYEITLDSKMTGDEIPVSTQATLTSGGGRLSGNCDTTAEVSGKLRVSDRNGKPVEAA